MSRFPTGVTVATTLDPKGEPVGMTASAVASVSLVPPMLLVCVDHTADFHQAVSGATRFALSVLSSEQEHLSRRFAEDRPDRFEGIAVQPGPAGLPLIDGAVAHLVCDQWGSHVAGDHTVFFGRVTSGVVFDRRPLVHFLGDYTTTERSP
jgi:flavin reductase (DIM6/NTAB) family NADH-FMN oxidoreductase RutF